MVGGGSSSRVRQRRSRLELLCSAWISIEKRLPPDTDELILVWNYELNRPWVMVARVARQDAARLVADPAAFDALVNVALFISHWTRFHGPEGEIPYYGT